MERITIDDETKKFLMSSNVPREVVVDGQSMFPKEPKAAGYKAVVWKGKDTDGSDVAIKFAIHADYMDKSYLQERRLAAKLKDYENFSIFERAGTVELDLPKRGPTTFICFVERWINGITLEEFLESGNVTLAFCHQFTVQLAKAINILAANEMCHDDLHTKNIMIESPRPGVLNWFGYPLDEHRIKIIDMGSLKPISQHRKEFDDHSHFCSHLVKLHNSVNSHLSKSQQEYRFLLGLKELVESMSDDNTDIALRNPANIIKKINSIKSESQFSFQSQQEVKLNDPFDYIAAEHIVDDRLLMKLFAESCPWLEQVSGPDPILLTGPRGCGKSMVFRRLSLKAMLNREIGELKSLRISGFYLSCSADIRNRLSRFKTEGSARRFSSEITHYFNLLLLREVATTLYLISKRGDRSSLFGFAPDNEEAIYRYCLRVLNPNISDTLRLQGSSRMLQLVDLADWMMDRSYSEMLHGRQIANTLPTSFITDLSKELGSNIGFMASRKPTYLVDDYSVHRVPEAVQNILNAIIWDRQPTHIFKVSSEKYGVDMSNLLGINDPTRELREIDAGREYIDLSDSKQRKRSISFATELLAKRLQLAGYKGTPEYLLPPAGSGLGRRLRDSYGTSRGGKSGVYFGIDTISDICSGDISVLLEVFRQIFSDAKVNNDTTDPVPEYKQDRAIRMVSRSQHALIRLYPEFGKKMYEIVEAFGHLSRQILQYAEPGADGIIKQTSRIEVEHDGATPVDDLAENLFKLCRELIRKAVFIEMEEGLARHKNFVTLRWQLRRIYCPTFGTSLAKNVAIKWKPEEFKHFLLNPREKCDLEYEQRWQPRSIVEKKQRQGKLFKDK
jgi:tRNA A-37 threonylcarbamoyl transferase component Bud32